MSWGASPLLQPGHGTSLKSPCSPVCTRPGPAHTACCGSGHWREYKKKHYDKLARCQNREREPFKYMTQHRLGCSWRQQSQREMGGEEGEDRSKDSWSGRFSGLSPHHTASAHAGELHWGFFGSSFKHITPPFAPSLRHTNTNTRARMRTHREGLTHMRMMGPLGHYSELQYMHTYETIHALYGKPLPHSSEMLLHTQLKCSHTLCWKPLTHTGKIFNSLSESILVVNAKTFHKCLCKGLSMACEVSNVCARAFQLNRKACQFKSPLKTHFNIFLISVTM